MKKIITMFVCLLFVLTAMGLAFAEEQKTAPVEKKMTASSKVGKEKPAEKTKRFTGAVTALDAKSNTLTIKGKRSEVIFSAEEKTIIKMNGKKKVLADLKVGEKAAVGYIEADGKNIARSITVKSALAKRRSK